MSEQSADVVIVGGGVVGSATLYELASRGIRGLLLERGRFGGGGTGQSAAIVRMHYSNRPVVRMALRSREILKNFADYTGQRSVYDAAGWAFLVPDELADAARTNAEMNRDEGVDVKEVDPQSLTSLFPGLDTDGIALCLFEETSGYADPVATVTGYVEAARQMGAGAVEGVNVTSLRIEGDRVVGVDTADGSFRAGAVVLATGPWTRSLARTIGLSLPMEVSREHELVMRVPTATQLQASLSNAVECIYARPLANGRGDTSTVLIGRGFPKEYDLVDPDGEWKVDSEQFENDLHTRLSRRLPALGEGEVVATRVGLYDITPDWHPYLGRVDGFDGLVLATGGSGHCFKLAPAIGEMLAEEINGGCTDYADIELFALERIERGTTFGAAIGGNRA